MMDNELQHARMDGKFTELGLDLKYFYEDGDVNAFKRVRRDAEKLRGRGSTAQFLRLYVTLIAPGGTQSESERSQAKIYVLNQASANTKRKLLEIEDVIRDWKDASTLDAGAHLLRILQLVDLGWNYWVGHDPYFPVSGFFVGSSFTASEIDFT
ncbi:MAG: hypothetical protein NVV67_07475 [Pseudoxanthomonas sp.]|jgi:hypothetical protein|nr:hypothetical protein [Pseudoxanthomonas sp.]